MQAIDVARECPGHDVGRLFIGEIQPHQHGRWDQPIVEEAADIRGQHDLSRLANPHLTVAQIARLGRDQIQPKTIACRLGLTNPGDFVQPVEVVILLHHLADQPVGRGRRRV